jgi:hypothetical protein
MIDFMNPKRANQGRKKANHGRKKAKKLTKKPLFADVFPELYLSS